MTTATVMGTTTAEAPPRTALRQALAALTFHPGTTPSVSVGDRRVEGGSPRELRIALGAALYEEWHAGTEHDPARRRLPRRDPGFEARLTAAVPHASTPVAAMLRSPGQPTGPEAVVEIGRVLVRVPVERVRGAADAGPGDRVALDLPAVRPALSPGFLLVDGPVGSGTRGGNQELLRLYVHVADPEAAPRVWGALLEVLADSGVPYRAKVLSRPWSYPRRDAVVVYLGAAHTAVTGALTSAARGLPGVGEAVSAFAHRVAPGVAVAWEPQDGRPGWSDKSFGQHRAAAVADGVVQHLTDPAASPLEEAVTEALRNASVVPDEPARNTGSPALTGANTADAVRVG
ncbi:T3SS effector HopA1 family protein [Streptomyces sp. NPDC048290]|uniref:T3SS effector HopA1 family protein n=1 Tax=Streptomyces sp. NPDC048290 TaxID=3155811 RepID=UPI003423C2D4